MLLPLQTMPYMPPELLAQSQLTPKADVYSFGVVMWELLSGQVSHHTPRSPGPALAVQSTLGWPEPGHYVDSYVVCR